MASSGDDLNFIKADITNRILQHSHLQDENQQLEREYHEVKSRYDAYVKASRMTVDAAPVTPLKPVIEVNTRMSLEDVDSALMIRKAQVVGLQGLLMDLEYQEHLWKLKAADVEYQRQTAELDLALKEHDYDREADVYLAQIDRLNRLILRNRLEEKELLTQYAFLESEAEVLNRQYGIFERETAYLQKEAASYKDLQSQTEAQLEQARQRQQADQKAFEQALAEKTSQKNELEAQLQALRQERAQLDDQLTRSLQDLEGRAQLVEDIKNLKDDNQRLQSAIAGLQSRAGQILP